jgi:hypothetical protein
VPATATAKPSEYRVSTGVYQMTITINYPGLLAKL